MDVNISTDSKYEISELDFMHEDIREKYFSDLKVHIVLDHIETMSLVEEIIKQEADIDLFEYSIKIGLLRLGEAIDEAEDITASERRYINNTLKKKFGNAVMKDEVTNTINTILDTSMAEYNVDSYGDVYVSFKIPFDDYPDSKIRDFLSNL